MRVQRSRPRRAASARQIALLRALGWRYSATRNAWVHRAMNGRIGPVFQEVETGSFPSHDPSYEPDPHLVTCLAAAESMLQHPRTESGLPRRLDADGRPVHAVSFTFADESPRTIHVDGRPPRLGDDPSTVPLANPEFLQPELFAAG